MRLTIIRGLGSVTVSWSSFVPSLAFDKHLYGEFQNLSNTVSLSKTPDHFWPRNDCQYFAIFLYYIKYAMLANVGKRKIVMFSSGTAKKFPMKNQTIKLEDCFCTSVFCHIH